MVKVKLTDQQLERKRALGRERARAYRERLKLNPDKLKETREKANLRKRKYRDERSEEKRATDNAKQVIRQRRYTEKKSNNIVTPPITRIVSEKRREYWKVKKQEQRKRMSSQKKRRIKEHDVAYRRKKRQEEKQKCRPSPSEARHDQSTSGQSYSTPSAKRKAASRAKDMLPTDAGKFAEVIDHIIANATPNKKTALREKGLHSPAAKRRKLDFHTKMSTTLLVKESSPQNEAHRKVRRAVTASLRTLKKHRMLREISRTTGITWRYLMRYTNTKDEEEEFSRKKRSDTISQETVHAISRHYSDHEVTTPLPNHKLAQGECEGRLLNKPLNECYDDFTQKNPDIKVSRSTYCKLRPQNVVSYRKRPFLQCLCEYCVNVENAMNVINQTCTNLNLSDLKISTSKITSFSLCSKLSTDSSKACIDRQCATCGVHLVRDHLGPVIDASAEKELSFYQWENHQYEKDGIRKTKKVLNKKTCILAEIVDCLCELLTPHSRHLFNAMWQQRAFSNIKSSFKPGEIVSVIDFAENYSTFHQNEVQSAHWVNDQVTLFPIVAWYRCPVCPPEAPPVREYLIFLSDDIKHDYHAVHAFQMVGYNFLREHRGIQFEKVIEFSDGCPAQFKSRCPFADISYATVDLGVMLERHFFGSRHGKNDSDGASGVIKSSVRRAVLAGRCVISNAEDLYDYCNKKLLKLAVDTEGKCQHVRRSFFHISNINRVRPERCPSATIKGTRSFHSVKTAAPGAVLSRNLSCLCEGCRDGTPCSQQHHVEQWVPRVFHTRLTRVSI